MNNSFDHDSALAAIGEIGGKEAAAELDKLIMSNKSRSNAGRCMEKMGEIAEPYAWKYISDGDANLQQIGCRILGEVGGNKSLARLKAMRKPKKGATDVDRAIKAMEARLVKR